MLFNISKLKVYITKDVEIYQLYMVALDLLSLFLCIITFTGKRPHGLFHC